MYGINLIDTTWEYYLRLFGSCGELDSSINIWYNVAKDVTNIIGCESC